MLLPKVPYDYQASQPGRHHQICWSCLSLHEGSGAESMLNDLPCETMSNREVVFASGRDMGDRRSAAARPTGRRSVV